MSRATQQGFTLLELTLVLLIISLTLTITLAPLSALLDGKRHAQAELELEQIREALLGFAMINGYLPCPATAIDPAAADYGQADAACDADADAEGYLPWRTLGVKAVDPWGLTRSAETDPFNGYWRYRVDRDFSEPFALDTSQKDMIMVENHAGDLLTSDSERPVAVIYSTGANFTPDGQNATYENAICGNPTGYKNKKTGSTACAKKSDNHYGTPLYQGGSPVGIGTDTEFDDILIWISRPLLFNRMVSAGQLP